MNFPTLMDLASQVAYEDGEQSTHKLQLALYHCVQAVKRLTFDLNPQRRRAELLVSAARTAQLPAEAVALSVLLTPGGLPILADPTALGTRAGANASLMATGGPLQGPGLSPTATPGRGRRYGLAPVLTNTAGHYQGDVMSGLLTLSPDCPVQAGERVSVIYTTSGIDTTGPTLVHPWSEQFIISYVQYKMMSPKRSIGLGEKQLKNEEWKTELRLAAKRFTRSTKAEWLDVLMGRQRRTL